MKGFQGVHKVVQVGLQLDESGLDEVGQTGTFGDLARVGKGERLVRRQTREERVAEVHVEVVVQRQRAATRVAAAVAARPGRPVQVVQFPADILVERKMTTKECHKKTKLALPLGKTDKQKTKGGSDSMTADHIVEIFRSAAHDPVLEEDAPFFVFGRDRGQPVKDMDS